MTMIPPVDQIHAARVGDYAGVDGLKHLVADDTREMTANTDLMNLNKAIGELEDLYSRLLRKLGGVLLEERNAVTSAEPVAQKMPREGSGLARTIMSLTERCELLQRRLADLCRRIDLDGEEDPF